MSDPLDDDFPDWYAVLRVREDATAQEITEAYRRAMRTWHPDVNASLEAATRTQRLNRAYEVLGDVPRRAAYDAERMDRLDAEHLDDDLPPRLKLDPQRIDLGSHGADDHPTAVARVLLRNEGGAVGVIDANPKRGEFWQLVLEGTGDPEIPAQALLRFDPSPYIAPGKHGDKIEFLFESEHGQSRQELSVECFVKSAVRPDEPRLVDAGVTPTGSTSASTSGMSGSDTALAWAFPLLWVLLAAGLIALPFGIMSVAIPISHVNDSNASLISILVMLVIGGGCLCGLAAAILVGLPACLGAAASSASRHWFGRT